MFFEELRALPGMFPSLKETGFYISSTNLLADTLITPIVMLGLKLFPTRGIRPLGKLVWWSMTALNKPPYRVVLSVWAKGLRNGEQAKVHARIEHADGYELTAIPVVAFLQQYLDGSARKPGLWMMGHLAEPVRLMQDMNAMGAKIETIVELKS
jgi:saccharopine dehydrogenase (NAD+, L-lysine-forming)